MRQCRRSDSRPRLVIHECDHAIQQARQADDIRIESAQHIDDRMESLRDPEGSRATRSTFRSPDGDCDLR